MITFLGTVILCASLVLGAWPPPVSAADRTAPTGSPALLAQANEPAPEAAPESAESSSPPAPAQTPAPPPGQTPPPPQTRAQPTGSQPALSGQWVYTDQYGWVWMPYADAYTYVPPDGYGEPYMYLYYPAFGWTWVVAPWVWGWGPWPHFGIYGPLHFAWYGHGWWRSPWRWHHGIAPYRGGFAYHGVRPAPTRGAFVGRTVPGGRAFVGHGPSGGHAGGQGGHAPGRRH